jgi:hypothetical protein
LTTGMRHFEQALRADRPPSALSFATSSFLPATQGQRCMDSFCRVPYAAAFDILTF